jgi:hypothetical protein
MQVLQVLTEECCRDAGVQVCRDAGVAGVAGVAGTQGEECCAACTSQDVHKDES